MTGRSIFRFLNPIMILIHLSEYTHLIRQLVRREVFSRYKGSFIGIGWAFIHPLFLLGVYTFVFSVIFEMKWGVQIEESRLDFAMALFAGILTFNIIGDLLNMAPGLILATPNYVKRVIFPLEILPLVKLAGTLIHSFFGIIILLITMIVVNQSVPWTILLLPLIWLPVCLFSLGWAYFLASIGVFIRDVGTSIGVIVNMLFFLSPIFYPLKAVPENLQIYCRLNPIAIFVEDVRRVVLWGQMPDWPWFLGGFALSLAVMIFGFIWFMKSKRAFADVL